MNKYPTFNKYFNRTPKGYLLFFLILHIVTGIFPIAAAILTFKFDFSLITSIISAVVFIGIFYYFYNNQITLVNARIGKHLKNNYNLEGEQLKAALDSIEKEINAPLYADATNKRKYNTFFITQNWLVGTDGIMLLRANACRRDSIKTIEKNYLVRHQKGMTYYYFVLQVTENNGYIHRFYLRSEENRDMAYDFLIGNSAN